MAHPDDYAVNLRLGWLSYLDGRYADADNYYRIAAAASPQSREAKLGLLLPLLAQGQYRRVEYLATQILQSDPENYFANLRLSVALRNLGKYTEAAAVNRRMSAAYPSDVAFRGEQARAPVARRERRGPPGFSPDPGPRPGQRLVHGRVEPFGSGGKARRGL